MKPLRWVLTLMAVVVLLSSCGLPDSGPPRSIDPTDVPYHLLGSASAAPSTTQRGARTTTPRVYLMTGAERLVAVEAPLPPSDVKHVLEQLLSQLAQGPNEAQRSAGLGTALGPGVTLTVNDVTDRTAVVQLDLGAQDPAADKLPLAIGQIVLTATSVRGVDRVQLVRQDGQPIEVPLPGGALTVQPLEAKDYAPLAVGSARSTRQADPT
ncbi:MAG: GerMN domain-containing protein [Humibacillus sp.]|nr:GerMN domain-containing protein [Humibacillus sp.]